MNEVEVEPVADNGGWKLIEEIRSLEEVLDFSELLSQQMRSRSDGFQLQPGYVEGGWEPYVLLC